MQYYRCFCIRWHATPKELRLYDYQQEALDAILKYKRGMVVLPTGAGKTIIGIALLRELIDKYKRVEYFVLVPTRALVIQWLRRLSEYGIPLNYGEIFTYPGFIQFVERRSKNVGLERFISMPQGIKVIIIDESHHAHIGTKLWDAVSRQHAEYLVGFTATPNPHVEYELPIIYQKTIGQVASYLADFELEKVEVKLTPLDLTRFKDAVKSIATLERKYEVLLKSGELEEAGKIKIKIDQLLGKLHTAIATDPHIIDATVNIALQISGRTLIKTNRIEAANEIEIDLDISGVPKSNILNYHSKSQIKELYSGKWTYVITVKALSEGIDVPDITNVILSSYDYSYLLSMVQTIGRALRRSPGKKKAKIYVLVPNVPQYERAYKRLVEYMEKVKEETKEE